MRNVGLSIAAVIVLSSLVPSGVPFSEEKPVVRVRTDTRSIQAGNLLFLQKCSRCHDPAGVGQSDTPGLKGILKNPVLPVSKKPATPENVVNQIRHPYQGMPLFRFSDEEMANLLAYLNTL